MAEMTSFELESRNVSATGILLAIGKGACSEVTEVERYNYAPLNKFVESMITSFPRESINQFIMQLISSVGGRAIAVTYSKNYQFKHFNYEHNK